MGGQVNIQILDNGAAAIVVPVSQVQVVIGCCSSGTANQCVATKSPATLQSTCGYGPGVEAAALAALSGATVIFVKVPSNTAGAFLGSAAYVGSGTLATFIALSGTPYDTYYAKILFNAAGTTGTAGITFQFSLDNGRNYGPTIALGTALTYAIPNTGITLTFTSGKTVVVGDYATFATTEPLWNQAGLQAAFNAIFASPYSQGGFGSMHVVGKAAGSDATTIEGYLDTWAAAYLYTRSFLSARDASPASTAWGGSGETETAWMSAIGTDYSAVSARRVCAGAAYWNMPSAYTNAAAGTPAYRRPLAFAAAARQAIVPPQRHIGRVKDGALSQIVVNPSVDPTDGFVYHDEGANPGLDFLFAGFGVNRFMSTCTRRGKQGVFVTNPLLASPSGSSFVFMPLGLVMDVACGIVHTTGLNQINDDLRLNTNGTLYVNDALAVGSVISTALNQATFAQGMTSQPGTAIVDQTNNVQTSGNVNIAVTIYARGYVLQESITIQYGSTAQA